MKKIYNNYLIRKISGWIGYIFLIGLILYIFAPASWWQFGVTDIEKRNTGLSFSLRYFDDGADVEHWNFSDQRGKVVVINYWATWCPPCRFEMPGLVSIANEFKEKDVEFVGITVDEDLSVVPAFIEKYQITYPILLPGNDPNISGEGMSLPTTFLYDKDGKLAKKYTGIVLESTLQSDINELLKE